MYGSIEVAKSCNKNIIPAKELPMPKGRKYTLNFPVTAQTILDAKKLSELLCRL